MNTEEKIDRVVQLIMIFDGPDRHTDGSDIIASYVMSILNNKNEAWITNYLSTKSEDDQLFALKILGDK